MTALDLGDGLRLFNREAPSDRFDHEAHLRFAWAVLDEAGDAEEAGRVACLTIRHLAELAGAPDRYHCTMTLFWTKLLDRVRRTDSSAGTLEAALDAHPELRNSRLPDRYWSDIYTDEAREHWVEPDLLPMP